MRDESNRFATALIFSTVLHAAVMVALVFFPDLSWRKRIDAPVVMVNLVDIPSLGRPDAGGKGPPTEKPGSPATAKPSAGKPEPIPEPAVKDLPAPAVKEPAKPAEESPRVTEAWKPKEDTKKKSPDTSKASVEKALEQLQKKVAGQTPTTSLRSAMEKMRQNVAKAEKQQGGVGTGGQPGGGAIDGPRGQAYGIDDGAGRLGSPNMLPIDIYRVEVAMMIQQNWAYSEQLGSRNKNLQSLLMFRVLPNGEIRDVAFANRSGNTYLDDSAYRAILKSNPVRPFPPGLNEPYVEIGLRFTPEGIQ